MALESADGMIMTMRNGHLAYCCLWCCRFCVPTGP